MAAGAPVNYNSIENIPPPVQNVGLPTADEVLAAVEFSGQLKRRRIEGIQIPAVRIVESEIEALTFGGGAVAPAWFNPIQAQLNLMQNQLNNIQLKMDAASHNNMSRLRNSKVMDGLHFGTIRSEMVGPNLNGVPPHFPINLEALNILMLAQLNQMEIFYGVQFEGANVVARRQAFATFIGCF
mmetsp:Transcript_32391/g.44239  ORF Transcript_32391/g.44239 Transcript_32391/m.44239 type:complete len:183 (-) Transcript_32391:165-713(-)